ncbi:MAG: hypothetical protein ACTHU0_16545 [Kofleriaceae bacterium]
MDRLRAVIDERFEGSRARSYDRRVDAELAHDGVAYRARLEMGPDAWVAVELPCTDGFELTLRWNDRWTGEGSPRAPSFDDSFLVETNDLALASAWLDHEARAALLASRYVSGHHPARHTALMFRDGTWCHEVANDQVSAHRRDGEISEDRMADMLLVSLLLASRPVRWARAFGEIARALGGEPASRIEVGGKPVLRVRRGAIDVHVRLVRRLGPADPGRLRTIVNAHRQASTGETLSLVSEGLPRAAWPPPADPSGGMLAIDPRAAQLIDLARPSATTVRTHDVEIAFDGALGDRERLGAAIELAAWWALDSRATGPYR